MVIPGTERLRPAQLRLRGGFARHPGTLAGMLR